MTITIDAGIEVGKGIVIGGLPVVSPGITHTITANGNAQVSTTQYKFGTGSYTSNALRGFLRATPVSDLAWGTGDFTMEFWYYPTTTSIVSTLVDFRPVATEGAYPCIYINSTSTVNWYVSASNKIASAANVLTLNSWNSIAIVRYQGSTKLYVNGTQTGATYTDTNNYIAGACLIGADGSAATGVYPAQGNMDEIRFSNIARYTTNYTPATQPFATDVNTILLVHCDGANGSTAFIDSSHYL